MQCRKSRCPNVLEHPLPNRRLEREVELFKRLVRPESGGTDPQPASRGVARKTSVESTFSTTRSCTRSYGEPLAGFLFGRRMAPSRAVRICVGS